MRRIFYVLIFLFLAVILNIIPCLSTPPSAPGLDLILILVKSKFKLGEAQEFYFSVYSKSNFKNISIAVEIDPYNLYEAKDSIEIIGTTNFKISKIEKGETQKIPLKMIFKRRGNNFISIKARGEEPFGSDKLVPSGQFMAHFIVKDYDILMMPSVRASIWEDVLEKLERKGKEIIGNWGEPVNGLQAVVNSDKVSYKKGESMRFEILLKNVGTQDIWITDRNLGYKSWHLELRGKKIIRSFPIQPNFEEDKIKILPGQTWSYPIEINNPEIQQELSDRDGPIIVDVIYTMEPLEFYTDSYFRDIWIGRVISDDKCQIKIYNSN